MSPIILSQVKKQGQENQNKSKNSAKIATFEMRPLVAKCIKHKWTRFWNVVTFIFGPSNLVQPVKS